MNTMNQMRAVALETFGGKDVLQIQQLPIPEPDPEQVLIQVACAGVNPADWKDREGHLAAYFDAQFPYVLGFDAAGIVVKTGAAVTEFAVGDRVYTASDHGDGVNGSYAEYLVARQNRVAKLPDEISFRDAASIPIAAITAWQALFNDDRGALQSGQTVLIHGASGGVGSFAVQFARWAGANIATTCSTANMAYVSELGSDFTIDYQQQDIHQQLKQWMPQGVDLVIDAVGCGTLPDSLELPRQGGRLVSIATLVGDGDIAGDITRAQEKGISKLFSVMDNTETTSILEKIADLVVAGKIAIPPIECFALDDIAAAHQKIESGHVRGKLVVTIRDEN